MANPEGGVSGVHTTQLQIKMTKVQGKSLHLCFMATNNYFEIL